MGDSDEREAPQKIHIIGSVGSGKTTLARTLSARLHIPFYELDTIVWKRSNSGDIRKSEWFKEKHIV
ncbi:shikimate kinase [Anoxybacteroides tepidamans]|uniref:shikimate kinase n=1 Tax=Anoxybacteroides tepidamans TaxID=265948 RepID=UPI0006847A81